MNLDNSMALRGAQNVPNIDAKRALSLDDAKLKEQTDRFESIFLKEILDIALKSENSIYPKAVGHDIYQSMYKEELSENLSGSFGYSELLFNYLKEQPTLKSF